MLPYLDSNDTNLRHFAMVPQVPEALFVYFFNLFFFVIQIEYFLLIFKFIDLYHLYFAREPIHLKFWLLRKIKQPQDSDSQSVLLPLASAAARWDLLEMYMSSPCPRHKESEILGQSTVIHDLRSPPGDPPHN